MNESLIIHEKLGSLNSKVSAAHARLDKIEIGIRDDLKELKFELKALTAHMNKGKGLAAAMMIIAGILGASMSKILLLLSK